MVREAGQLFCRGCKRAFTTTYVPEAPSTTTSTSTTAPAPAPASSATAPWLETRAPLVTIGFLPRSWQTSTVFKRVVVVVLSVTLVVFVVVPWMRSIAGVSMGPGGGMVELGRQTVVYADNANGRTSAPYLGGDRVLVSAHWIIGGGAMTVYTADRNVGGATIVKLSTTSDLAVLSVPGLRSEPLRALDWGDAATVRATDRVYAFSYVTSGGLSVTRIALSGTQQRGDLTILQSSGSTDVTGTSGPVLDGDGRIVGMTNVQPRDRSEILMVASSTLRGFVDGPDRVDMPVRGVGACKVTPGAPEHFLTPIQLEGRIRAVVNGAFTGFGRRNDKGRFEGLEPDLVREISMSIFGVTSDRADDCIEFVASVPDTRLSVLAAGRVDLVMAGNTTNDLQAGVHTATNAYFTPRQFVLVRDDSPLMTTAGLAGKTLCTFSATYDQNFRSANIGFGRMVFEDTLAGCLLALEARKVDAVTATDANFAANNPRAHGHRLLSEPLAARYVPYLIVVRERQGDLVTYLNQIIATVARNGTYRKLYDQNLKPLLGVDRTGP